ncbi:hypothetical protein Tco_0282061 [Tanacetum coccineum]
MTTEARKRCRSYMALESIAHVSLRFATSFIYAWLRLATLMHVSLALAFLMLALAILDLPMCCDCVSLGCDDPLTMLCGRGKWNDGKVNLCGEAAKQRIVKDERYDLIKARASLGAGTDVYKEFELADFLKAQLAWLVADVCMTDSTTITAKRPKRPVRPKRTWTPHEDEKLMDAIMELHASDNSSDTLNSTINAIGNEMNINLSKMANDQERKLQCEIDLMKRVQKEIDALPGITFEEAFEATDVIGKCPFKAELLFG